MPEEQLILVDERNRAVGTAGKMAAHRRDLLHRAFSIFVVDAEGRIVLQQRNRDKYHSGGLWANSCCGHPRPGERTLAAAHRRLREELGIDSDLSFAFFARYRSALDHGLHENELVYVYFGRLESRLDPDPAEVAATDLLSCAEISRRLEQRPSDFAVWFQHYFRNHGDEIAAWAKRAARQSTPP